LFQEQFWLACALLTANAMTAAPAVVAFSTNSLIENGLAGHVARWSTVGLAAVNFGASFLAIFLLDACGRRPLLFTGLLGSCGSIFVYSAVAGLMT